jgi:hypothetical protein
VPLGATQKFDAEKFNLKKLNDVGVKEECQVNISKRYAAFENFGDNVDVNKAWESIRISSSAKQSIGHYELKQHKQWFDEWSERQN